MKKIAIFLVALVTMVLVPLQASATVETADTITKITELTEKLESKRERDGFVSEDDVDLLLLSEELSKLEVTSSSYGDPVTIQDDSTSENIIVPFGYGTKHDLGKGWKARVDKPSAGDAKPHIHVYNGKVDGVENVDGTKSHGKTLGSSGIPKGIQNKAKGLADYKKAQKDLTNIKKAKQQMKSKGLNLRKNSDIIIAIGIFVSVVGFLIFASGAVATWGAFLLLI